MSITDELRKFAWKECPSKFLERVIGIADDIDRAHTMELGEVVDEFKDCILPPKDADGQTIHIGDRLDGYNKTIEVVELRYGRSGWVLISRDGNAYVDTFAFTHVRPDSWERIISDALRADRTDAYAVSTSMLCELVERCKRLAGEDA